MNLEKCIEAHRAGHWILEKTWVFYLKVSVQFLGPWCFWDPKRIPNSSWIWGLARQMQFFEEDFLKRIWGPTWGPRYPSESGPGLGSLGVALDQCSNIGHTRASGHAAVMFVDTGRTYRHPYRDGYTLWRRGRMCRRRGGKKMEFLDEPQFALLLLWAHWIHSIFYWVRSSKERANWPLPLKPLSLGLR
jgi:hypothetical protein